MIASAMGGLILEPDSSALPWIDAAALHAARGCECICGEPLADGALPINGRWRMMPEQWARYKALCAQAEAWTPPAEVPVECCAAPFLFFAADLAPVPEWIVWPLLLVITGMVLVWVAMADVGPFPGAEEGEDEP